MHLVLTIRIGKHECSTFCTSVWKRFERSGPTQISEHLGLKMVEMDPARLAQREWYRWRLLRDSEKLVPGSRIADSITISVIKLGVH